MTHALTPICDANAETQLQTRRDIRQHVRALRRAISPSSQQAFAQAAAATLLSQLQLLNARHVALYLANDGELDPRPLITQLWQAGINTYLPVIHPFCAGQLLFLHYHADTPMHANQFGILEPKLNVSTIITPDKLDVIITPLVAFDAQGNRMGMGGGYYDRTLSQYQTVGKPIAIGYAHDCQQIAAIPCEHWDIPLPLMVTPTRLLKFL